MKVTASAPGKLMLLGEHAVMYGYPCLVSAVNKKITVSVEQVENRDHIVTPQNTDSRFVQAALAFFKEKYAIKNNFLIETQGDFTHKVGLGSSSAVTVAVLKALSSLGNISLSEKELFDISYSIVLDVQGKGSGFDIAAAIWGGVLFFKKGAEVVENLNIDTLPLIVGYSGEKADTTDIINKIAKRYQEEKTGITQIFNKIGEIVQKGKDELLKNNYKKFGETMSENHHLLKSLGVSTDKLDTMVKAAIEAGAWGAKLSGAGGGDCMIALVDSERRAAVKDAIFKKGGEIIDCEVNWSGVITT